MQSIPSGSFWATEKSLYKKSGHKIYQKIVYCQADNECAGSYVCGLLYNLWVCNQVMVPRGKRVTALFYMDKILTKLVLFSETSAEER